MAVPPCGTFDYVAIVPDAIEDGAFECLAESREAVPMTGDRLVDSRLVGLAPLLTVSDASLPERTHGGHPEAMRSRVTLTARTRRQAQVAAASFYVSKRLMLRLKAGDVIHLARTHCAGLGLSVVRSGRLVAAAGAVTAVPLGHGVTAGRASDLMKGAIEVFRTRDPDFSFEEIAIEITVDGRSAVLFRGRRELGPFDTEVMNGFIQDTPGTDECAAIARRDACSLHAAVISATWLNDRSLVAMSGS
jgi:hypothetical protein